MDTFEEGIKYVKYLIEKTENYKIHIYYNDYDEEKLEKDLINKQKLPEERYYLKDKVSDHIGEESSLHIFYERNRYYGINADSTSHHFRLGAVIPEEIINYLTGNYKSFKLMDNRRLESGMQNKVFFIELIIKETSKNKK